MTHSPAESTGALRVIERDGALVVVDKPSGLRSTREAASDRDNAEARLEAEIGRRVWAVHQLDRGTSGVLLLVDRKPEVARWSARLAAGSKTYLALCRDRRGAEARRAAAFEVDEPLLRTRGGRVHVDGKGKPARTRVQVVAPSQSEPGEACAVLCRPATGRTHQVRVHLAHARLPVVGDPLYGDGEGDGAPGFFLHLWRIRAAGREFGAAPPERFARWAGEHGFALPPSPDG